MWGWACREDTPVKGTRTPVLPGVLSPPSVPGLGGRVSGTAHARLVRAPAPHPLAGATLQALLCCQQTAAERGGRRESCAHSR